MNEVKVTFGRTVQGRQVVVVKSPFHPNFLREAKRMGGQWSSSQEAWYFDVRDEADVRDLCRRVYGTDGEEVELVDVELHLDGAIGEGAVKFDDFKTSLWFGGRCLARVFGRDSGVKLGDEVRVAVGDLRSGGSRRYPLILWDPWTVLIVRDVPATLVAPSESVRIL